MESFSYKGNATIKHLNVRKEGGEDDRELAVDVKFEGTTDARALCDYFDDGLHDFLFNEIGAVRNLYLNPVCFGNEIKSCNLSTLGRTFHAVTLKKFSLAPMDGKRITLTFSATFFPTDEDVAALAGAVTEEIQIVAKQEGLLFDGASSCVKAAVDAMEKTARRTGIKTSILDGDGKTLITFGEK